MSTATRLSFNIKKASSADTLPIQISDPRGLSADNLPLETWGSAEILASQLHKFSFNMPKPGNGDATLIPVLELGAGTGIAGLSAAALWHTTAVLTDLPPIIPGIEANVALNRDLLASHSGQAFAGTLDWFRPSNLTISNTASISPWTEAQVILAADTIYSEDHPELLSNAIAAWLAPGRTSRAILCYPLRVGYLDHIRDLWEILDRKGLECVSEGRGSAPEEWDEDTPYEWCLWGWKKR